MARLVADLNARTADDRIRLDTRGSRQSLTERTPKNGEWVWLVDGDTRVPAELDLSGDRALAAPDWSFVIDGPPDSDPRMRQPELSQNLSLLQSLMKQHPKAYRTIWSLLPFVERSIPSQGWADYMRSRAAVALGNLHVALLTIEDALSSSPDSPAWVHHRITVLSSLEPKRAYLEARDLVRRRPHAFLMAAYAQAQSAWVRAEQPNNTRTLDEELLDLTREFCQSEGFVDVPASLRSLVYVTRGYALVRLTRPTEALAEFGRAIEMSPDDPNTYAARGLQTYPAPEAIEDLKRARRLGFLMHWVPYFLAHEALIRGDWTDVKKLTSEVLTFHPPSHVAANAYEWRAIAAANSGEPPFEVRKYFKEALTLAPDVPRIASNLATFEHSLASNLREHDWVIHTDQAPDALLAA